MKLNLRDSLYWLIILLMGGFIWYQIRQAKIQQDFAFGRNLQFNDAIEKARTTAAIYADSVTDLTIKSTIRRQSDSVAIMGLKIDLRAMSKKVVILRVPVDLAADSIQPLRDYLILADSLSAAKDSLISEMELRHSAQLVDMNEIIRLQNHQLDQQMAITASFETELTASQGENKKLKRGNRVLKVVAVAGVLFGVWQAVK